MNINHNNEKKYIEQVLCEERFGFIKDEDRLFYCPLYTSPFGARLSAGRYRGGLLLGQVYDYIPQGGGEEQKRLRKNIHKGKKHCAEALFERCYKACGLY